MALFCARVKKAFAVSSVAEGYSTIQQAGESLLVVKKSRFIGRCFPARTESESAACLDGVRKAHWDATHNCYAYRIGCDGRQSRSSDDGEPSGTAGLPILQVLLGQGLVNVLCVVTRYFGGVLLGAGGLVRAYTDAAAAAVKESGVVLMRSCTAYEVSVPYPLFAVVENLAAAFGGIDEKSFTDVVRVVIWVPDEEKDHFLLSLTNVTGARARAKAIATDFRPLAS